MFLRCGSFFTALERQQFCGQQCGVYCSAGAGSSDTAAGTAATATAATARSLPGLAEDWLMWPLGDLARGATGKHHDS